MPRPTSSQLRTAATALDALEHAETYLNGAAGQNYDANVTWHFGSATPGYKELQAEVSRIVNDEMPELLARALANLRGRVETAMHPLKEPL